MINFIDREDLIPRLLRNLHKIKNSDGFLTLHPAANEHWYWVGMQHEKHDSSFFEVRLSSKESRQHVEKILKEICYELSVPFKEVPDAVDNGDADVNTN